MVVTACLVSAISHNFDFVLPFARFKQNKQLRRRTEGRYYLNKLSTKDVAAAKIAPAGIVINHAQTILRATPQ